MPVELVILVLFILNWAMALTAWWLAPSLEDRAMGAIKLNFQEMAIRAIRIDNTLQSRVETKIEAIKDYADALVAGAIFPAVVVFFDGQVYWLADGFHRVAAYKQAGRVSIPADVREGTRHDATIYSAGANTKMGIRPTTADRKKAAFMLFAEGWHVKPDATVGVIVGATGAAVRRWKLEYCTDQGIPLPEKVGVALSPSGKPILRPYFTSPKYQKHDQKRELYKRLFPPEDWEPAKVILQGGSRSIDVIRQCGIACGVAQQHVDNDFVGFFAGIVLSNAACIIVEELRLRDIPEVVGRILLLREAVNAHRSRNPAADRVERAVVVTEFHPDADSGPYGRAGALRKLTAALGVEFMSPAEFLKAFRPKAEEGGDS